jgi:hypothetical protein
MTQVKGSYDETGGPALIVDPCALAFLCLWCRVQS